MVSFKKIIMGILIIVVAYFLANNYNHQVIKEIAGNPYAIMNSNPTDITNNYLENMQKAQLFSVLYWAAIITGIVMIIKGLFEEKRCPRRH